MSDDENRGLTPPQHTQVPNEVLDQMADLTECELRVILFAIRKIIGWHKTRDEISLTSFQQGTGLSRQGVVDGVDALIKRGWLKLSDKKGKRGANYYELRFKEGSTEKTSQHSRLVNIVDQSTQLTSTIQPSRPLTAPTSQLSRHTKEIKDSKENINNLGQESGRPLFQAFARYAFKIEDVSILDRKTEQRICDLVNTSRQIFYAQFKSRDDDKILNAVNRFYQDIASHGWYPISKVETFTLRFTGFIQEAAKKKQRIIPLPPPEPQLSDEEIAKRKAATAQAMREGKARLEGKVVNE